MEMTKEKFEQLRRCDLDDDLFGESLDNASKMEDNYVWSVYGQCWLPK